MQNGYFVGKGGSVLGVLYRRGRFKRVIFHFIYLLLSGLWVHLMATTATQLSAWHMYTELPKGR